MNEVVIVEAVRTPIGRRNGSLGGSHSIDVLGAVQKALFDRSNIDPASVGQVVGGSTRRAAPPNRRRRWHLRSFGPGSSTPPWPAGSN